MVYFPRFWYIVSGKIWQPCGQAQEFLPQNEELVGGKIFIWV
jgi:hypothetical protein